MKVPLIFLSPEIQNYGKCGKCYPWKSMLKIQRKTTNFMFSHLRIFLLTPDSSTFRHDLMFFNFLITFLIYFNNHSESSYSHAWQSHSWKSEKIKNKKSKLIFIQFRFLFLSLPQAPPFLILLQAHRFRI